MTYRPDLLSSDERKALQTELKAAGFYRDEIDGIWGPNSRDAFARFQSQRNAVGLGALDRAILAVAGKYVGLSEVRPNDRWDDLATPGADAVAAELRRRLLDVGWQPGYAYCIAFAELVWREAYERLAQLPSFAPLSSLITLGVVDSFQRLKAAGRTTNTPVPGAIFFLRHGNTSNGHAGIVLAVGKTEFATIEANTAPTSADVAKDREGDGIYAKSRPLDFRRRDTGLWLLGFCNPG